MNNQFNKQNLEKLGIFELRNLAREVGVYSPTTYKKEELIDNILLIIEGKKEPHVSKNKQGRPPKFIHGVNNILDIFIPKTALEDNSNEYNFAPYDVSTLSKLTAMSSNNLNMQYQVADQKKVKAIIEVFEEGYAFCYEKGYRTNLNEQNFFVANALVSSYNLKSGDIIEAYVKKIADDKPYVVYKLEKINNVDVANFNTNRKDFSELVAQYPTQKLNIEIKNKTINHLFIEKYLPIGKGQRAILALEKNTDYAPIIIFLLNNMPQNENLIKKCLLIDERPEDITEYCNLIKQTKIICTSVDDEPYQALQKVELSLEQSKRAVEENKDVVLLISNLSKLHNLYRKKFILSHKGLENQDKMYGLSMIKKILSSARKTQNGGSLTIFAIIDKNLDEDIKFELKELCNMCIVLNEKNYLKPNKIWFDVINSKTRRANLLLSEQEYSELEHFRSSLTEENADEQIKLLEEKLLKQL